MNRRSFRGALEAIWIRLFGPKNGKCHLASKATDEAERAAKEEMFSRPFMDHPSEPMGIPFWVTK